MNPRLLAAMLSHWRQGRTLTVLTIVGVALGVASVVCIQTLNQGALAAFDGGMAAVSGEADLMVRGQGVGVDERLFTEILGQPGVAAAWPLTRNWLRIDGPDERYLDVVGVDVFAPVRYPISSLMGDGPALAALSDMLTRPGWIALTPDYAAELNVDQGDSLVVVTGDRRLVLQVGALVDFKRHAPLASRQLALMDIAQSQHLLGIRGRVDQIDIVLAPDQNLDAAAARLQQTLGPAARVLTPDQRRQDAAGLLAAFRLNLTALSLISVLVGMFLVFSAVHASLVRRRRHFGLLRSLGAGRGQVLAVILLEAGALGVLGTLAGLPLGYLAAKLNMSAVNGTLTSIYLLDAMEGLPVPPLMILAAVAVGLGGAVLGALLPALDIARRDPVDLLSATGLPERLGKLAPRLAVCGLVVALLVGIWAVQWGADTRVRGFVLAFFVMVILPLFTPLLLRSTCAHIPVRGFGWQLGLRGLANRLQTTSFAVAALAVTVSMLVGITLLIGSFRTTLETWIERSLVADVYVTGAGWQRDRGQTSLADDVVDWLANVESVRGIDRQRRLEAYTAGGHPVRLLAINRQGDLGAHWVERAPLLSGDASALPARLDRGELVISEPLARRLALAVGDSLALATPTGTARRAVAAVAYDYASENGVAFMTWPTLAAMYGDGGTAAVALTLDSDADVEATIDGMRTALVDRPLEFRSNRRLRSEVLEIFDQTFAVTTILQAMALVIAVCGVSLTLLIVGRERATELALHRSLGATRGQVFRLGMSEGAGLGVMGLSLGLVGGGVLAVILILIINRDWFGWTIRFDLPLAALVRQAVWIMAGALAAALYPALRASNTPAGELTREDLL